MLSNVFFKSPRSLVRENRASSLIQPALPTLPSTSPHVLPHRDSILCLAVTAELRLLHHIPSHNKCWAVLFFRDFKALLSSYPCATVGHKHTVLACPLWLCPACSTMRSIAGHPMVFLVFLRYLEVLLHFQAAPDGAPCLKPFRSGGGFKSILHF